MLLYADENIEESIIRGVRRRDIEVLSVRDLGSAGESDEFHLREATRLRAAMLTRDVDFLVIAHKWASRDRTHAGIIYLGSKLGIGESIRRLELLMQVLEPHEMFNRIEFL